MSGKPVHDCSRCYFVSHDRAEGFSRMRNMALAEP